MHFKNSPPMALPLLKGQIISVFRGHVHQPGSRHVRQNSHLLTVYRTRSSLNICRQMGLLEMVQTLILRFANMEKWINSLNLRTLIFRTLQYIYINIYIYLYTYTLSLTTAWVRIPAWACEKVATDLELGGGIRRVLRFPPLLTTG